MSTGNVSTISQTWTTGTNITLNLFSVVTHNALLVSVHFHAGTSAGGAFPSTVTDGVNTYTEVSRQQDTIAGDNWALVTYYAKDIVGGSLTLVAELNTAAIVDATLSVQEVSGADTVSLLDAQDINEQLLPGTGTDAITSQSAGGVSHTVGAYLYGAVQAFGSTTLSSGSTWNSGLNIATAATEWIANFSGGAKQATFTETGGAVATMTAILSVKAASSDTLMGQVLT